jgi:hypothetical protein
MKTVDFVRVGKTLANFIDEKCPAYMRYAGFGRDEYYDINVAVRKTRNYFEIVAYYEIGEIADEYIKLRVMKNGDIDAKVYSAIITDTTDWKRYTRSHSEFLWRLGAKCEEHLLNVRHFVRMEDDWDECYPLMTKLSIKRRF